MSVSVTWQRLVSTALMGTERTTVDLPLLSGPLGGHLSAAAGEADPTSGVLRAAALLTAYRRAGRRPVGGLSHPAPAEPEERPVVPPAAARRLDAVLTDSRHWPWAGGRVDLLAEWLTLAESRRVRAPAESLPALLDAARHDAALRPAVRAVGGHRAVWLAGQRDHWRYLLAQPGGDLDVSVWAEGTAEQRSAYLGSLRRTDPAAARDLLAESWGGQSADERTRLLAVLRDGLSDADEPFCEDALDDRSAKVRQAAADLLAGLPTSRLAARMARRATPLVTLGRTRLSIEPPGECDPGMRRDGIVPKPPAGIGERAWWLRQAVARTPLSTWVRAFDAEPEVIVRFGVRSFMKEWHHGLAEAAVTQRDATWAEALLGHPDVTAALAASSHPGLLTGLAELLPVPTRVRHAVAGLAAPIPAAPWLLRACPAPWPDELAAAVLRVLAVTPDTRPEHYRLMQTAGLAAERLDPAVADLAGPAPTTLYEELMQVLRLRADLTKEFA